MTNEPKSTAICVLGVHRSGTSAITRGLNLLGAWLGEEKDLMKPLPENPEGFWERLDIYYLQDRLLTMMKRSWDATAPLQEHWHQSAEIRPLRDELVELVKNEFSGRSLWLWKDPRTCLLLPLWRDVLKELGIDLKVVFVVRHPLDVARSLKKRNGFTLNKGLGIWFNNTLAALKGIDGLETLFLSYDSFLDDWEAELRRCADGLGIKWPVDDSGLRVKMASFVRRELRHSVTGGDELLAVKAPEPIIRLYGLLLDVRSGGLNASAVESMTEVIYQEFLGYARLFEFDMAALADCRSQLEEMSLSPEALPAFVEIKKELHERTQWAWKLNEEVRAKREQIISLKKDLSEHLAVEPDNRLQEVLDSMSWKITRPLRVIHGLLLKLWKDQ